MNEFGTSNGRPVLFAHGFGCTQEMWRHVWPDFDDHRVVLFDQVGAGGSDLSAYDRAKYNSLHGYADDVLGIVEELDLHDVVYVGHSVGAMIGVLAATSDPSRFGELVLVGPSPRYLNDEGYSGGFDQVDIDALLESLDADYLGWSSVMGPTIMGNSDRPELGAELTESFCSTDPGIARHFAAVTFLSDNRRDLPRVSTPTLVVQCSDDAIAPLSVGTYVHQQIAGSELVLLNATGHCPNLSAPAELSAVIRARLERAESVEQRPAFASNHPVSAPATAAEVTDDDLADLYERAPCGHLSVTTDGVIIRANLTFAELSGRPAKELLGKRFTSLLAVGSQLFYETRCLPLLLLAGELREVPLVLECPGTDALPILVNVDAVLDEHDGPRLMRIAVFDSSARQDYERELLGARLAAERFEAQVQVLQYATLKLGAERTVEGVAAALSDIVRAASDAASVSVMLVDDAGLQLVAVTTGPTPSPEVVPMDAQRPEAESFRHGETITVSSISDMERRYPAIVDAFHDARVQAMTVTPLLDNQSCLGVLVSCYARTRAFTPEQIELHTALVRQGAQALRLIRLQLQLRHAAPR